MVLCASQVDLDSEVEGIDVEHAMFYKARLSRRHIQVESKDYLVCPDFASIYQTLTGAKFDEKIQR